MDPEMSTEDVNDVPFEACAHCGASFEPGVSYPVETRTTPDGDLRLHSFCDEGCRREWTADPDS